MAGIAVAAAAAAGYGAVSFAADEKPYGDVPVHIDAASRVIDQPVEPVVTEFPDAARKAFAAARNEPSRADEADEKLAMRILGQGVNPSLARRVITGSSRQSTYYLVPGLGDAVCLVDGTNSGGCSPAEFVAERGMIGADECPAGAAPEIVQLHGLVADGVDAVQLHGPRDAIERVKVVNNAWSAQVGRHDGVRPTDVSWVQPDGREAREAIPYTGEVAKPCQA